MEQTKQNTLMADETPSAHAATAYSSRHKGVREEMEDRTDGPSTARFQARKCQEKDIPLSEKGRKVSEYCRC